ncbi:uncharacterized protein LOC123534605 [Mercenaria mercenaria]|uniref:uncharacterized protein LOC123534605 n=1 Tax=Mercenaria mercenaria TaxID=6596 RepID=UPI00234F7FFF|nr:uncharacterized protein LOC123534605 [Mercenaria mercenaria]
MTTSESDIYLTLSTVRDTNAAEETARYSTIKKMPCCSGCCGGNGYTRNCTVYVIVIVAAILTVGSGISMFLVGSRTAKIECNLVLPNDYAINGRHGYEQENKLDSKIPTKPSTPSQTTKSAGTVKTTRTLSSTLETTTKRTPETAAKQNDTLKAVPAITTVFTRWGRSVCTSDSNMLYSGYTAGIHTTSLSGTSSILCLPRNPEYAKAHSLSYINSEMYSVEFAAFTEDLLAIFGNSSIKEHVLPCAVCEVVGRGTSTMFPALTKCFQGWTFEYSGYLMSAPINRKINIDTKCIDSDPEALDIEVSRYLHYEAEFAFISSKGKLPAPPYVVKRALTCVVCTK